MIKVVKLNGYVIVLYVTKQPNLFQAATYGEVVVLLVDVQKWRKCIKHLLKMKLEKHMVIYM